MNANRVTTEQIDALMARLHIVTERVADTTSTVAHAFIDGFYLDTGHSACVDPANFNEKIGSDLAIANARDKARAKLWLLEGYALHKEMNRG